VWHASGAFERAAQVLEDIRPEAEALVKLRPGNYQWRRSLMDVLTTLGEARGGKTLSYWRSGPLFDEAHAIAELLHERDPSSASLLFALITLCDRRANAAAGEGQTNLPAARPHRRKAAQFARKLSALDETNVVWRYLLAYTLGTSATHLDVEEALSFIREARAHTQYALKGAPDMFDITDFLGVLASEELKLLTDPKEKIQVAAVTVDTYVRISRDNPDAYWPVKRLGAMYARAKPHLLAAGPGGEAELQRIVRLIVERARARAGVEKDPTRREELENLAANMETLLRAGD
jgi:hypothetical protein